jgi:hypothetical protein
MIRACTAMLLAHCGRQPIVNRLNCIDANVLGALGPSSAAATLFQRDSKITSPFRSLILSPADLKGPGGMKKSKPPEPSERRFVQTS